MMKTLCEERLEANEVLTREEYGLQICEKLKMVRKFTNKIVTKGSQVTTNPLEKQTVQLPIIIIFDKNIVT